MKTFYIIDWLINKPIELKIEEDAFEKLNIKLGDKILYRNPEADQNYIGIYLWYWCDTIKEWEFIRKLSLWETQKFEANQEKAQNYFKIFKKDFKERFPESVPINARMDLSWNNIYFYFYAEVRFQFGDFLKEFRKKIWSTFFLFQIWARDRVRFSHWAKEIFGTCWQLLCCKTSMCPLPSVDSENIIIQNLENRWIEKMKWRCGKLKCCLNYEKDIYVKDGKAFPKKWDTVSYQWRDCTVYWFNILSGEIIVKDEKEDQTLKVTLWEIKIVKTNTQSRLEQQEIAKIKQEYKDLE